MRRAARVCVAVQMWCNIKAPSACNSHSQLCRRLQRVDDESMTHSRSIRSCAGHMRFDKFTTRVHIRKTHTFSQYSWLRHITRRCPCMWLLSITHYVNTRLCFNRSRLVPLSSPLAGILIFSQRCCAVLHLHFLTHRVLETELFGPRAVHLCSEKILRRRALAHHSNKLNLPRSRRHAV